MHNATAKQPGTPFDVESKRAEYARYPKEHLHTLLAETPDGIADAIRALEEAKRNLAYWTARQRLLSELAEAESEAPDQYQGWTN